MKNMTLPFLLFAALLATPRAPAQELQDAGQVVIHGPTGPARNLTSVAWQDLPGARGALTMPKGGHLAISLTSEAALAGTNPTVVLRALVDGNPARPGMVRYLSGARDYALRSCTFHAPQLAPGTHRVQVQYAVSQGATFIQGDQSMLLRFAEYSSRTMQIRHARGPSATVSTSAWQDLTGVATDLDLPWDGRLEVAVSGEFRSTASNHRVFLRVLVDNQPCAPSDAVVATGPHQGIQTFLFVTGKIAKGKRKVKVQWSADGKSQVDEPILTVTALPDAINWQTGWLQQSLESPFIKNTGFPWSDVPGLGGKIFQPAPGDLALRFSGEFYLTGTGKRAWLRVLVDGKPAAPSDVVAIKEEPQANLIQSREALFVVRNLPRGWHTVKLQWSVDSGGTLHLGDRCLSAVSTAGQTPLLVVAMESDRGDPKYQYGGLFGSKVVQTVGGQRVFRPYVGDTLFRSRPGVADWFLDNSGRHLFLVEAAVLGPYKKRYNEKYYREQVTNPFTTMKVEALTKADQDFDYADYDRDNDGTVRTDELAPLIVFYQDTTFGEVRGLPNIATADGVTLDYSGWGQATIYVPDFTSTVERGLTCHELSHLLIHAGDMYETTTDPTAPGPYSIMDQHHSCGHLDPMHKVVQGKWFEFVDVGQEGWHEIDPVGRGGTILKLRDRTSHTNEYFLVENRQGKGYNDRLPDRGLAIWHCDESRLPDWRTCIEMEPECGPITPIDYRNYLYQGGDAGFHLQSEFWDGSPSRSRWHDNTWSGIGVFAVRPLPGADGRIRAYIDLPGAGVLVQLEHPYPLTNARGEVVTRVRVVNTARSSDSFQLTVQVKGTASWTSKYTGNMTPYQEKVFALTVKPNPQGRKAEFSVSAVSVQASGAACTDTARVSYPLAWDGNPWPGGTVNLDCLMPAERNHPFLMCASLGWNPGFTVPGAGHMALNPDSLFLLSWSVPSIFQGFMGTLDAGGQARPRFAIPPLRALKGIDFHFAFVTYDFPDTFREISNTVLVPVR